MRKLANSEITKIHGGRIKVGGPAYTSTVAPPTDEVHISISFNDTKFSYDGQAKDLADAWQGIKDDLKAASWDGLEALTLVDAGIACELPFNDVCTSAQGNVEFVFNHAPKNQDPDQQDSK